MIPNEKKRVPLKKVSRAFSADNAHGHKTLNQWVSAIFSTISHFQIYTSRVPAEETYPFDINNPFAYTVVGWQSLLIGFYVRRLLFLLVKLVDADSIRRADVSWIIHNLIDRKTIYIC